MVGRVGPSATIHCEPRQIRKEAAAAADSCAGVWLAWFASLFSRLILKTEKISSRADWQNDASSINTYCSLVHNVLFQEQVECLQ